MKLPSNLVRYFLSALVAFVSLSSATAWAYSFNLTGGNAALAGYPAPYATVTVTLVDSTHATILFDALTTGGNQYLLGDGGSVGVNVNGTFSLDGSITGTQAPGFTGASYSSDGAGNEDGFGSFNFRVKSADGYGGASDQITFNLLATGSNSWASAADVLLGDSTSLSAAAHIFVCKENPCVNPTSGGSAIITGFAAGNESCPDCVITPHDVGAPEPGSLLLLGTGLVAVARRFRRSKA